MSIITDMKPVTQELVYGSMDPCLLLAYTLVPMHLPSHSIPAYKSYKASQQTAEQKKLIAGGLG